MTITVSSGVTSSGLDISSSNALLVLSGGAADATTVLSGGTMKLSSGAAASGVVVSSGGLLEGRGQLSGSGYIAGQVIGVSVSGWSGASYLEIESGGSADEVLDLSILQIDAGATATGTVVSGDDSVYGVASGTILEFGFETVFAGGTTVGAVVGRGGGETIDSGGVASGATVEYLGGMSVDPGGSAVGVTVAAGGGIAVSAGATATGIVLSGAADSEQWAGDLVEGVVSGTVVDFGGQETVSGGLAAGENAVGVNVESGGTV